MCLFISITVLLATVIHSTASLIGNTYNGWYIYTELCGNSSVVRAPDSWSKGRGFESRQERRENLLLQGQLSVLTLILISFHPRVTAVTRKRSRAFCQKCRWRVTDKHTSTLRIWLCMKWQDMVHGCMVHTELARYGSSFTWHQPVTTKPRCKYTASVDIQTRYN